MHRIRVSKQIMHISQDFLISPYQKDRYIVRLFLLQAMYRHIMCYIPGRDKIGYLSIGITGNVLQGSRAVRFFIQTLNGHNRKYLVDRPRIRKRLKKWEVTEIFISQQFRQSAEFIGSMFQSTGNLIDFTSNRPVKTYLLGIMPCFKHLVLIQCIPNAIKFLYQFMRIRSNLLFIIPFRQSSRLKYLKNQDRVVCSQSPATLSDNIGMGNTVFVTGIH